MKTQRIGIIMNGVTGRMGTNQHLIRSICAIIKQGGIAVGPDLILMPEPLLTGRNENKLRPLAEQHGIDAAGEPFKYTTDVAGAIAGKHGEYSVFFDASGTLQREAFVDMAAASDMIEGIYCEKPTATTTKTALDLAKRVEKTGKKNGVVQDKLWLPGLRKVQMLKELGFFGKILSVRSEFGYWVFSGVDYDQPTQRPSWNYKKAEGGGILVDMFCHWQYVIAGLFGPIKSLVAHANVDLDKRRDESGAVYDADAEDSAYAMFLLEDGTMCQFNSSWVTRVRRDDLLSIQIDGTKGSAVAGLRDVRIQSAGTTPKPVWNPDIPQPIDFHDNWQLVPDNIEYDNAFKIQWELFLRHLALDEPFRWTLREGARGVQLAELGMQSWQEHRWIDVPEL